MCSLRSLCTGLSSIQNGENDVVLAGGVDFMSDVPIRYNRKMRKMMLQMNKVWLKSCHLLV